MTPPPRPARPSARPAYRHTRPVEGRPLRTGRSSNLPHVPSSFVGREREVTAVATLLEVARLVTLSGPAGMGKTRLAIEVGLGVSPDWSDGAWMVELAPLSDPAYLPEAVAAVLPGSERHTGQWSAEDVAAHIGDKHLLLVLDNCEHLVEPSARLVDLLLRTCPRLRILATSREPLGVNGEHRFPVGPLSADDAGELFARRAVATAPEFSLTEAVAPTVAAICKRLDGMPLAIELAAARMASLSPADVLERLDDRFLLLTTGSRAGTPRHQTLAATLEWSHDQLSAAEAAVLRRVSVFAGWALDAAPAVCAWGGVQRQEIVDHLAALAAKSLVVVERSPEGVRYSLLETIRAWARVKLEEAAEAEEASRRHADWCLRLATTASLDRLDVEHDNLRAALEWTRSTGDAEFGVQLVNALTNFWYTRGHLGEGLGWLEWAGTVAGSCPLLDRAALLRSTGLFRGVLGETTAALALLEESSALFAKAGDHDASLCACESMFHMLRNPRQSLPGLEEDVDRCRSTRDTNKLAHFLWALGQAHFLLGELTVARRHFEECVQLGKEQTDGEAMRSGLFGLGRVAVLLGDARAAQAAFEEGRASAEQQADVDHLATGLVLLADLARARGDYALAHRLLDDAMSLTNADGSPVDEARALYFAARLAEAEAVEGDNGAGDLYAEALSLARFTGGLGFHEARCLLGLGWAAMVKGDRTAAAGHLLEALATAQAIEDAQVSGQAFDRLGRLARLDGRREEAETLARRALELHHRVGDVAGLASVLESMAAVSADGERWLMAARLMAAAQSLLDGGGFVRGRSEQARYQEEVDRVRAALGDQFEVATADGASLSIDEAVAYASRRRGPRDRPVTGWDSLTPAEREVAQLVGEGLTNPEVGRRLFISPRTVGHHLAHVYQKLGIHSRGALIKQLAGAEPDKE